MAYAKDLYEVDEDGGYWASSYQPMLDSFGDILVQVDDEDYQGDSRVLYYSGGRYGWLQFGWGSCSGCDALQACDSIEEVQELMDDLCGRIQWWGSAKEALDFFKTHDWKGDYSWSRDEQMEFVGKAIAYLEAEMKTHA